MVKRKISRSGRWIESFPQRDPERRALSYNAVLDEDLAFVVVFDDALGERQAKPPAAFLRGVAGLEDLREHRARHPLAGVGDVDEDVRVVFRHLNGDAPVVGHRVDGVLREVLQDPAEQRGVEWRNYLTFRK